MPTIIVGGREAMTSGEVAEHRGVSKRTQKRDIQEREFPKPDFILNGWGYWFPETVDEYDTRILENQQAATRPERKRAAAAKVTEFKRRS
jgi:hypothetical protein